MILVFAVLLDFLIGDPSYYYHPIRIMGRIIRREEQFVRAHVSGDRGLFWAGLCMLVFNLLATILVLMGIFSLLNDTGAKLFSLYLIYSAIAGRELIKCANAVRLALFKSLEEARYQLSMIVGRDTANLSEEKIVRATVETVAENTSDGIIAPLFYILFFGPVGGMVYKFVNTMDSTIGYRNEKYEYLGKAAAIFDDWVNFIPARITGLLFVCAAYLLGYDARGSYEIMIRDHGKHKSPNAGYPEAAMAGMLGVRLGGPSQYFGHMDNKPYIGNDRRPIKPNDITRANRAAITSEIIFVIIMVLLIIWR